MLAMAIALGYAACRGFSGRLGGRGANEPHDSGVALRGHWRAWVPVLLWKRATRLHRATRLVSHVEAGASRRGLMCRGQACLPSWRLLAQGNIEHRDLFRVWQDVLRGRAQRPHSLRSSVTRAGSCPESAESRSRRRSFSVTPFGTPHQPDPPTKSTALRGTSATSHEIATAATTPAGANGSRTPSSGTS